MNKKIVITVSVLVIFAVAGVILLTRNGAQETTLVETSNEINEEVVIEETENLLGPENTVDSFLSNFILSTPPSADEEAVENATMLLSERAKMGMEDKPTSGDLARFVGVQDIPDNGYEIGEIIYKDNTASGMENGLAEIEVTLKYSGGDVVKTFLLSEVEDFWQIDGVEQE